MQPPGADAGHAAAREHCQADANVLAKALMSSCNVTVLSTADVCSAGARAQAVAVGHR